MNCKVCSKKVGVSAATSYLTCMKCECKVHQKCLYSIRYMKYPMIIGDVFYLFTCRDCNNNNELVVKGKPKWSDILLVVLYSLQEHSAHLSLDGYFHWKIHICNFINEHWKSLFGSPKSRRNSHWRASVSGTLSHYKSMYFKANETSPGWWKLVYSFWPQRLIEIYQKKKVLDSFKSTQSDSDIAQKNFLDEEMKLKLKDEVSKDSAIEDEKGETADSLKSDTSDYDNLSDLDSDNVENMTVSSVPSHEALLDHDYCQHYLETPRTESNTPVIDIQEPIPSKRNYETHNVSNDQSTPPTSLESSTKSNEFYSDFTKKLEENEIPALLAHIRKPVKVHKISLSNFETLVNTIDEKFPELCGLSTEEELAILKRIYKISKLIPKADKYNVLRKLHRILDVRRFRRANDFSILSINDSFDENLIHEMSKRSQEDACSHFETVFTDETHPNWFKNGENWKCCYSPYTSRLLKPLIFRDFSVKPLWLTLMEEIRFAAFLKKIKLADRVSEEYLTHESIKATIDYSYVSPHHLSALNSLSCRFFWPGIELVECLHYPDFTCVAMYKKLIVGFGMMIPNMDVNEAYITYLFVRPYWRKCGIATFIIYHLMQSCMGKDITLHVSADNTAILLYQKFGFKIEDYILNFYDKYLPIDAKESRHAFFLRFTR